MTKEIKLDEIIDSRLCPLYRHASKSATAWNDGAVGFAVAAFFRAEILVIDEV
jgi:hypothetical protein